MEITNEPHPYYDAWFDKSINLINCTTLFLHDHADAACSCKLYEIFVHDQADTACSCKGYIMLT